MTDAKPTFRYLFALDECIGDFALTETVSDENGAYPTVMAGKLLRRYPPHRSYLCMVHTGRSAAS